MSLYLRQICVGVFVGPCPVLCCFAVLICGETQIWLGDLRVALGFWWFSCFFVGVRFNDDLPIFTDHTCPCTRQLFTAYAIVRTEPSATSAIPEEKKRHNRVQLFISHLASWLHIRHFSKLTFRATNHWKNTVFRDFLTFSHISIFFLLTLSLLLFSLLIFLFSLPLPCSFICPYCRKFDF